MIARLDEAVAAFDQPSMDGINILLCFLGGSAGGLKVGAFGLGSDEIFGGYSPFRSTAKVSRAAAAARMLPSRCERFFPVGLPEANAFWLLADSARKGSAAFLDPDALPHPYFFTRAALHRHRQSPPCE